MITYKQKNRTIIDCHLHLPWESEYKSIDEKRLRLDKELKNNSVDYGILIADSISESSIGNNYECFEVINDSSNLFMMFGFSPLERVAEQLLLANEMLKSKKVVAVKIYPGHEDFCANDARLDEIIGICIKYDKPLVIHTAWDSDEYPQYSPLISLVFFQRKTQN